MNALVSRNYVSQKGESFFNQLAALPRNVSASRLLERRGNPIGELINRMNLSDTDAESLRRVTGQEELEWVRWVDAARSEGIIDEDLYNSFIADLMDQTDLEMQDLLDEVQLGLYDEWRRVAFAIDSSDE